MSPIFVLLLFVVLISTSTAGKLSGKTDCGPNAYWSDCATDCDLKCSNYKTSLLCTDNCKESCRCQEGYIYDDITDKLCVIPEECPQNNPRNYFMHGK